MGIVQAKLFLNKEKLVAIEIPEEKKYYSFIQEYIQKGYRQIIIPSDILVELLKYIFLKKENSKIIDIEFLEEDEKFQEEIDNLIHKTNNEDRGYFVSLLDHINYVAQDKTVEIKKVRFKYRVDGKLIDISISINGLLNYKNNTNVSNEIKNISQFILDRMGWII
ncbi:hypothetical protein ABVR74_02880 [Lactococcus lactis subsp. lactis]|uniref:hypothetical protein n=1 Tax=Lactococcus lactis TaxID=1358 RepID=UPI0024A9CA2C|nr:hypothetical protein [Lactococcus lactis]